MALDVQSAMDTQRRDIIAHKKHNGLNQQWDLLYVKTLKPALKKGDLNKRYGLYIQRPFFIQTQMPSNRYLDIVNGAVVLKTPNSFKSQQWYFDNVTKTIRSVKTNQSFNIQGNGRSKHLRLYNNNSRWWQLFYYRGNNFVNVNNNRVVTVSAGKDYEGQAIWVQKRHNKAHQRWNVVYVDTAPKENLKDIAEDWGFQLNKDFFFVSRMPMRRVAATDSNNVRLVTLKRTDKRQMFFFDSATKTIKSSTWKDRSLSMSGNNLRTVTTNARWFQLFRYKDAHLINERGKAMDVSGG